MTVNQSRASSQRAVPLPRVLPALTKPAVPEIILPPQSEAHFQAAIIKLARVLGWTLLYHTHDSRRSAAGFPDLFLCKPPRVVALECKKAGGKVTPAQEEWIRALSASNVEARIVWPEDLPMIVRLLQGEP